MIDGEVNEATMTKSRTYHLLGNLLHFHAFSAETGGNYCVVEDRVAPGAGAPPNSHAGEQEAFYVLEGRFRFQLGDDSREAGPGDFVVIPDGAVHAFSAIGDAPGRVLIINAPGRVHDAFFTEAGEAVPEGTTEFPTPQGEPDIPRVVEIGRRAGIEFTPPA